MKVVIISSAGTSTAIAADIESLKNTGHSTQYCPLGSKGVDLAASADLILVYNRSGEEIPHALLAAAENAINYRKVPAIGRCVTSADYYHIPKLNLSGGWGGEKIGTVLPHPLYHWAESVRSRNKAGPATPEPAPPWSTPWLNAAPPGAPPPCPPRKDVLVPGPVECRKPGDTMEVSPPELKIGVNTDRPATQI